MVLPKLRSGRTSSLASFLPGTGRWQREALTEGQSGSPAVRGYPSTTPLRGAVPLPMLLMARKRSTAPILPLQGRWHAEGMTEGCTRLFGSELSPTAIPLHRFAVPLPLQGRI